MERASSLSSAQVGDGGRPETSSRSAASKEASQTWRRQHAVDQGTGRASSSYPKVMSGEGVKALSHRCEGAPGGGEDQEGIGFCGRLNPAHRTTDSRKEQGPEGEAPRRGAVG